MIKYRILFFIIILIITHSLFSQTILLPEEEAPSSIFSISPGGTDVDLYVLGTWETNITGGFGFSWNSEDKSIKESTFPAMISGLQLVHKPDIVISLWLLNSYFFETSFIDDYKLNTILFGYESIEDNFLQSVRIGNTDIGFGDYSYLSIPKASTDSMGGMALFKTDKSEHQLMVRYDPAELQVKNYIGKNEVDPLRVNLTDYVKGRYFILPDDNVDNLLVYIEDSNGIYSDGTHNYRLADSNDAIISAEEGIVFFRKPLTVRAAVHYTKEGATVGDGTLGKNFFAGDVSGKIDITATADFDWNVSNYLGQNMTDRNLTMNGSPNYALLLYEPGVFSPFEMLSVYSLPYLIPDNPGLFKANLVDIGLSNGENPDMSTTFEDYMVRFLYNGDSFRDPANRYPFAASINADSLIYEPDKELNGTPSDKELLIQKLFPTGSYYLGDNVLEGSVSVKFNGHDEYRYTFNPDSGTVNFLFPVPTDAIIGISYRTMTTSKLTGDLLVALGSKFNFTDNLFLETGAGLRWNILDSKYIEHPGEASGSLMGTAGLSYKGNNFDIRLDAGISVHSPNTTGILRLAGMNKSGFSVPVSANYLYPAAIPETDIAEVLNAANRGKLIYKDYHEYDSTGSSTLKAYNWQGIPLNQIYDYDTQTRIGPYIASAEIDGDAAVIDYNLSANEWIGGRIPISLGSDAIDLSSAQSMTLQWKDIDKTGSTKIYIRVGKLAEDLDNDLNLDKETSSYDTGFIFNDGQSTAKIIGVQADGNGGNNQLDTEDLNGNSILDTEQSDLILTKTEITDFTAPGTNWQTVTLNFSPSDREKLRAVTGFEIIIVENAASTATGRLLVGDISFNGSSFVTNPDTEQLVTAKEVNEAYTSTPTPLLTTNYPEVSIFSTSAGAQNVAEINWDTSGMWKATSFTEPADLSDYNKISFYMKTPDSDPSDLTFSLTNPSGKGISVNFVPVLGSANWIKYTVDYRNGKITADGSVPGNIIWLKNDSNASDVNRLSLTANCTIGAGTLLIDEVSLEDPVIGVSGAASTVFNYKKPGTIIEYKDTPILSNFNFSNSSSITGKNFASGFTNNSDSTIYTASDAAISLLAIRINGALNLQWQETELFTSPALSVSIPFFKNGLILKDSYSEINLPLTSSTMRESSIEANFLNSSILISGDSSYSTQNLIRNWGISSNTVLKYNSSLTSSAAFTMTSKGSPYDNMNLLEKFAKSYSLFIPSAGLNDRNTSINIKPVIGFKSVKLEINEIFGSNASGIDVRELASNQSLSINAKYSFNQESQNEWNFTPEYKKTISNSRYLIADNNFFTDSEESFKNLGAQSYYYKGIPLWEIFFPDFGTQFKDSTTEEKSAGYTPEFSLVFSRLPGSSVKDIFMPSTFSFNFSRNLNRDFDSVTDSINIKLESKATALNIFGKLGTNPLFKWYQTEEITNILTLAGAFGNYTTKIFTDPVFNLNYILFLKLNINKQDTIQLESNQNFSWLPVIWKNDITASYIWEVIPDKVIKIPVFQSTENDSKPYFEHSEKITWSTSSDYSLNTSTITLTLNHSTNLIFKDRGNISIFAGLGIDQKNIEDSDSSIKYYLLGLETGVSAKLTF